MRDVWRLIGWLAVGSVAVGLVARWSSMSNTLLVGAIGLLPFAVAAAALVAAASSWPAQSWRLRGAAGVAVVAWAVTFVSPGALIGCGPTQSDDAIVVYTHNLLWTNQEVDVIAAAIAEAQPDVVVLQEVRRETQRGLLATEALAHMSYTAGEEFEKPLEIALWSRWPIRDVTLHSVAGRPRLEAIVQSPHGEFELHGVHLAAPVDRELSADWEAGLRDLERVDPGAPALLAGDFNATVDHAQFRSLLGRGWTDVHDEKGCGLDATWPDRPGPGFPVLRLDHVLVSPHWDVLGVEIGDASGSDHRPVVASIRLNSHTG